MPSLQELLDALQEDLELAKELVGSAPGPLDPPERKQVHGLLDDSETGISAVLVIVNDSGTADMFLPIGLPGIAALCESLAVQAREEAESDPPDDTTIGSHVKTIRWLINTTNGYRDRVGS